MASRGFEFAFDMRGSGLTPLIKDVPVAAGSYAVGDLCSINASGYAVAVTTAVAEVFCVIQEAVTGAAAGALVKAALLTHEQVWKCSMDAATTALIPGYTKTVDTVDANTLDADAVTGHIILYDTGTDDQGNVLAYVVFPDTTFGNS